jgi:protein-tyrosine phosphatase
MTLLSIAYALNMPLLVAKRPNGELSFLKIILNLPWLMLTYAVWYLQQRFSSEAPIHEIIPRTLYIGRRLQTAELLPEVDIIIDLTAEFHESRDITHQHRYIALPILDGSIPNATTVQRLYDLIGIVKHHRVYIHCAQGHGRTAMIASILLCALHLTKTPDEALELIRQKRPLVRVNTQQYQFIKRFNRLEEQKNS